MALSALNEPLRAVDRCDSCQAPARFRAFSPDPSLGLLFCGHHARKHAAALAAQGFLLVEPEAPQEAALDRRPTFSGLAED